MRRFALVPVGNGTFGERLSEEGFRYNLKTRCVEIRSPEGETPNKGHLQKAADFVEAFVRGFNVDDAVALIRLDHMFMESFEITDGEAYYRAV